MTALGGLPWRVGHKVPEHIYDAHDNPLVTMPTPELAALVVGAVNAQAPPTGGGITIDWPATGCVECGEFVPTCEECLRVHSQAKTALAVRKAQA